MPPSPGSFSPSGASATISEVKEITFCKADTVADVADNHLPLTQNTEPVPKDGFPL